MRNYLEDPGEEILQITDITNHVTSYNGLLNKSLAWSKGVTLEKSTSLLLQKKSARNPFSTETVVAVRINRVYIWTIPSLVHFSPSYNLIVFFQIMKALNDCYQTQIHVPDVL